MQKLNNTGKPASSQQNFFMEQAVGQMPRASNPEGSFSLYQGPVAGQSLPQEQVHSYDEAMRAFEEKSKQEAVAKQWEQYDDYGHEEAIENKMKQVSPETLMMILGKVHQQTGVDLQN
mmetsp:Transcript_37998/g.27988  ORF Transcript_37998/g.27988 Transcript_37998/m.27988 type:complete len:118 (+) Transcript_37998:506-859(+)